MARAMRPVVILMLLATVLFVLDGILDHNYAQQPIFEEYKGVGWTSFVFAIANLLMAIAVARGSERTLIGRIALSAFFIIERPVTAYALGPKPVESVVVHFVTAVVELIILIGAVRLWRLGHSVEASDMDALLSADPPGTATLVTPGPALEDGDAPQEASGHLIGLIALLLAAVLVADGIVEGYLPSGRGWDLFGESSGWLVYVFAVVLLAVATRAVRGGSLSLRLLFALALVLFIERAFSPFAVRVVDPVSLGLHGLAALISLALALVAAGAIRGREPSASASPTSPAT
jgi:hypothetical protein